MKKCAKCKTNKSKDKFGKNKATKDGLQKYCKLCQRKSVNSHYQKNKQYYKEKAKRNSTRYQEGAHDFVFKYLIENACIDCGETDPIVLEFDHRDPATKHKSISHMLKDYTIERIQEEISKCDVRCANCHRRKTAHQFDWWILKYASVAQSG